MVGKVVTQVGITKTNELTGDDSDTFERISQAINSEEELVIEALLKASPPFIRVVVPVLVVPTGALFQIDFNAAGDIHKHAHSVEEATLFMDHAWSTNKGIEGRLYYAMSHLHIVTFDALRKVTKRWMGEQGFFRTFEQTWEIGGDGGHRRHQKGPPLSCGAERLSSFSIALSNIGTPSSLPTTHRIPIRLAACSSSSVLNSVNITIGISGKALIIPSAAARPSESGIL